MTCSVKDFFYSSSLYEQPQDYKSYALVYWCIGSVTDDAPSDTTHVESAFLLSRSKKGLDAPTRQKLVDRLTKSGWNVALLQRVKTQSGC